MNSIHTKTDRRPGGGRFMVGQSASAVLVQNTLSLCPRSTLSEALAEYLISYLAVSSALSRYLSPLLAEYDSNIQLLRKQIETIRVSVIPLSLPGCIRLRSFTFYEFKEFM